MSTAVSPLAPKHVPEMPAIAGVRLATAAAGIRYAGRTDVLLALFDEGTAAAGVFTRSKCPSAPVEWCRAHLKSGKSAKNLARALVVNSGNANAFTGKSGRDACKFTAQIAARAARCKPNEIFLASTGVIGEPLKVQAFDGVMDGLVGERRARRLPRRRQSDHDDRHISESRDRQRQDRQGHRHHQRHRQGRRHDRARHGDDAVLRVHRRGDRGARAASHAQRRRRRHLQCRDHRRRHFHLRYADAVRDRQGRKRRASRAPPIRGSRHSRRRCTQVLANLAEQVARDGEGARKLVEITVEGAVSKASARRIALSIANSPLVKTAIAGEDANWGRVVMAVGKAGEPADRDRLSIWFGGIRVAHKGARDPGYDEAQVSAAMKKPEIALKVALGLGKGRDRVLTCDLTKEYVAINGDYRS